MMRAHRAVHPLLMEPTYWRNRLQELDGVLRTLSLVPRPDLSGHGRQVVEFRLRAHDGQRLWGLLARPEWHGGSRPAHIRVVGPSERPDVDGRALEEGISDIVLQESAGRRLEDRVLDVVRVCQMACSTEGIDPDRVRFAALDGRSAPDECLIAEQLLASRFC